MSTSSSNLVSNLTSEIAKIDQSIKSLTRRRRTAKAQLNRASAELQREQTMTLALQLADAIRDKNQVTANEIARKISALNEAKMKPLQEAKKPDAKPAVQAPTKPTETNK
ncbi:MAG: hypothetical protein FH747_04620 [Stenotrophomonas sp.]|uniref:hypothetical protein n=1 Tax=Stenotrophomonas sp. TaxID=69392 RepID=UPI0013551A2E|nr:hypothetical protein [Stenotrophomonas sp.]MTI72929.1 hypothetical protein [Stenotrophomonas sp.]